MSRLEMKGKWGLFAHFLDGLQNRDGTPWEKCVETLNVETAADQIAETGAAWFGTTLHQQTASFCCPNARFEEITGIPRGEGTVHRDLPMELGLALKKRGVALMLYHTGDGPARNAVARRALGMEEGPDLINDVFFDRWTSVQEEDARRYGDLVKAWWIDGQYPALAYKAEHLLATTAALKKYNPDVLISHNYYGCGQGYYDVGGIIHANWFIDPAPAVPGDDYTAGEVNMFGGCPGAYSRIRDFEILPEPESAQWHVFSFMGRPQDARMIYDGWGKPGCKYDAKWLRDYRDRVTDMGGAITIDCCLRMDGTIDAEQRKTLNFH